MNLVGEAQKNQNKLQILENVTFQPCLEENSSWFSRVTFYYTHTLLRRGAELKKKKEYLSAKDMYDVKQENHPKVQQEFIQGKFKEYQQKSQDTDEENLTWDEMKGLFTDIMRSLVGNIPWKASIFLVTGALLQFSGPIGLKLILDYLEEEEHEADHYKGYLYTTIILICYGLRVFLMQYGNYIISDLMAVSLNGFSGSLIEKVLKLSTGARKYFEAGKIMNLVTVDQQMIYIMCYLTTYLISSPIMVIVSMILICYELGWWGMLTPLFFLISFGVQGLFSGQLYKLRNSIMLWKDKRAKAVFEYFSGIRIIKYYAWEEVVEKKINELRKDESLFIMKNNYIRTLIETLSNITPNLISIIVIICYVAAGNTLSPSKAYTVIALFNLIMHPFKMMMFSVIVVLQTKASLKRMDHFMIAEDQKDYAQQNTPTLPQGTIKIENGTFAWETLQSFEHHFKNQKNELKMKKIKGKELETEMNKLEQEYKDMKYKDLNILKNINFEAKKGQITGIIGQVASGKTTLLYALLGELNKVQGSVQKNGSIAYVSQTAWMQNATIRDNILFGSEYNEEKFWETIEICELEADLDILPGGEMSEIGERGINLSGGQKQRLAIARAVYADADIYIIDDCLSALDAHVGKNIFKKVFKEKLKDRTVVFVTHALQYLPQMDKVCIMKGGKIVEQGSYEEISTNQNGEFQQLAVQLSKKQKQDQKKQENQEKEEEERLKLQLQKEQQKQKEEEEQIEKRPHKNSLYQEACAPENMSPLDNNNNGDNNSSDDNENKVRENRLKSDESQKSNGAADTSYMTLKQKYKQNQQTNNNKSSEVHLLCNLEKQKTQLKMNSDSISSTSDPESQESHEKIKEKRKKKMEQGLMTLIEERAVGQVSLKVYRDYLQSGGRSMFVMVLVSLIISQGSRVFSDWWIGAWTEDLLSLSERDYIIVYGVSGLMVGFFFLFRGILFARFSLDCADSYQRKITRTLLETPMWWFDITPTGRIISRCTKDQDDLDTYLPFSMQNSIVALLIILSALLLICFIYPLFLIVGIVIIFIFIKIVKYYLTTIVELKRIEANMKTPLISTIQESIYGTYIIRSFNKQKFYLERYIKNQHGYMVSLTNYNHTQRWIGVLTEIVALLIISFTCYIAVISKHAGYAEESSQTGLAITWAFQISMVMGFSVKMLADTEAQMNSLVRMLQYIEHNPKEKSWNTPLPEEKQQQEWPSQGKISLKDVRYRYRPELPEVIKGISFDIQGKEKIGIVGRTGSGKSTMTLGLLRILEMSQDEGGNLGNIVLDGQDIGEVGLHVLRDKCTIIPQDPLLFTGDLRYNIDPFGKYQDQEIIQALKQVQIWGQLREIYEKVQEKQTDNNNKSQVVIDVDKEKENPDLKYLHTPVDDGGENFSLGQRQLICMARALIRKPKVLLMDEATASIDEMTDHLIQKMIKEAFKDTTVITIAHRINTIMQYDKILVLEKGNIEQYDTPLNLLEQKKGIFYSLVQEGGKQFEQKMMYLAKNKDV